MIVYSVRFGLRERHWTRIYRTEAEDAEKSKRKSGTRIISNGSNAIYSEQAPIYG